jgi:hypothetical protein
LGGNIMVPPSRPPSLALIYLRAALGAITKKRSLATEISKLPLIPEETLQFGIDKNHVNQFRQVVSSGETRGSSAVGSDDDDHDDVVPVAYLQCLLNGLPMNLLTHAQFPLNIIGSVHESVKIENFQTLHTSMSSSSMEQEMQARCRLLPEIARSDKNDWIFTVVNDIVTNSNQSGGGGGGGGETTIMTITNEYRVLNPNRHKFKPPQEANDSNKPPPVNYWNEDEWEHVVTWKFPIDTGRRYAALNGDINPIHMFPLTAQLFGYKSCIAHGMFSVCKLLQEPRLESILGGNHTTTVTARFTRPTFLPNNAVMVFLKKGTDEYVIGTKSEKDGQVKETVQGTISSD